MPTRGAIHRTIDAAVASVTMEEAATGRSILIRHALVRCHPADLSDCACVLSPWRLATIAEGWRPEDALAFWYSGLLWHCQADSALIPGAPMVALHSRPLKAPK